MPDDSIFEETVFDYDTLKQRLREMAFLTKGLKIILRDKRISEDMPEEKVNEFHYAGGIKEFVTYLNRSKTPLYDEVLYFEGTRDNVYVEVAMQHNDSYNESVFSFVNNINTHEGGTHLDGFRSALGSALKEYGNKEKMFEKAKVEIKAEDFKEGLTAVVSVKVAEPQFEGQTKTKLGNVEVRPAVTKAVRNAMDNYLEEHPSEAHTIIEKVILAAQARVAARKARENVQKNSKLTGGGLPGKLADCSSKNPEECEIFLVEGDLAGGTAKTGRNRFFQAILPLRGKILNVEKVLIHKMLDSEEIQNMFRAFRVNLREDKSLDITNLRYHKIIIMTDADVDGAHIRTLLLTFFYRKMPELIEKGYVYLAQPPLYKVERKKRLAALEGNCLLLERKRGRVTHDRVHAVVDGILEYGHAAAMVPVLDDRDGGLPGHGVHHVAIVFKYGVPGETGSERNNDRGTEFFSRIDHTHQHLRVPYVEMRDRVMPFTCFLFPIPDVR